MWNGDWDNGDGDGDGKELFRDQLSERMEEKLPLDVG